MQEVVILVPTSGTSGCNLCTTLVPSPPDMIPTTPVAPPGASTHPNGTRLKHNIHQSKVRTDVMVTYSVVRSPAVDPTSHIIAMQNPLWHQAMMDEYQALL
jgi:hypothetical protein